MVKKKKCVQMNGNAVAAMILAASVSIAVTLICAAISATLIANEGVESTSIRYLAMGTILVSAVCGAAVLLGKGSEKQWRTAIASGGMYILVLLSITAMFFDGRYEYVWIGVPMALFGYLLPLFLRMNRKKRIKPHRNIGRRC